MSRSAAIGAYDGALRCIVHALKYDGRRSVAPRLGALMRESGRGVLRDADGVVPVPLHPRRQRERGFNQAADLAVHLGVPVVHALRRTRPTVSQVALPADDRRANVRGVFAIARRAPVRGSRLVLVDDVSTTGATLEACAEALVAGGAAEVYALTAARVVTRPPG